MREYFVRDYLVRAAALGTFLAAPLGAQGVQERGPEAPIFRATPYAGYMIFGKYLEGPLGVGLTNKSAPVYGAELGVQLTENVALVGNVGYARSSWQVSVPIVGGFSFGDASVLMYDAGVQLRAPLGGRYGGVTPVAQLGVGAMRHSTDNLPVTLRSTNLAFNAGLGFDYQLSRNLGMRVMAKDYISKLDFGQAIGLEGVELLQGSRTHNVAVSLGVSVGF